MWFLAYIFYAIVCGCYAAALARSKGRDPMHWFLGGLLFGIIGLLAAGLISPYSVENAEQEAKALRQQNLVSPQSADSHLSLSPKQAELVRRRRREARETRQAEAEKEGTT